jgi:hypothetical protein
MKPLTDTQKKYLWIAAGVLVLVHFFLPTVIGFFRTTTVHSATVPKPSPYVVAPVAPPSPAPPPEVQAASGSAACGSGIRSRRTLIVAAFTLK